MNGASTAKAALRTWLPICLVGFAVWPSFGCRRAEPANDAAQGPGPGRGPGAGEAGAIAIPDLSEGARSGTNRMQGDALWRAAGSGEAIDLARLAEREGAVGLLEGLNAGGSVGRTALAALEHAEDAEVALARLCELLTAMPARSVAPVLAAVHAIVSAPPEAREVLDVNGQRKCEAGLALLTRSSELKGREHDLAASALALVREHLTLPARPGVVLDAAKRSD